MNWAAKQQSWDTSARRLEFAAKALSEATEQDGAGLTEWRRIVADGRRRGGRLLVEAEITKLPSSFDAVSFVVELEKLGALHARRMMQEGKLRGVDEKALRAISAAAKRLRNGMSQLLEGEALSGAAFHLAEEMSPLERPWLEECRFLNHRWRRLEFLRRELLALGTAAEEAAGKSVAFKATNPSVPRVDALTRLLTQDLPALFERHMGRRCGWSDGSGGSGKATEGARFVAAARKYLRLGEVEPSSVNKRRKRKRKSGDITVQI